MKNEITEFDVELAYRKLKSYIYYDNYDLFSKAKIADFETDNLNTEYSEDIFDLATNISNKIRKIFDTIIEPIASENSFFKNKIDKISVNILPKSLDPITEEPGNIYTNKYPIENYEVSRLTFFLDADIELLIISVLWLLKIGCKLEHNLYDKAYANRLTLGNNKKVTEGLRLFKPYFNQYQKWRNEAIDKVEELIEKKEDAAIINLDIQNFFYNATISEKKLNEAVGKLEGPLLELHKIFIQINREYTKRISRYQYIDNDYNKILENKEFVLPIGLPTSYVLANWYMDNFDKRILQEVKPIYYSRYVDDILIVLNNPDFEKKNQAEECDAIDKTKRPKLKVSKTDEFILKELSPIIEVELIQNQEKDGQEYFFKIVCEGYEHLKIQTEKTFLYLIDANESTHFIDRLKKRLKENSSEFRDLPNESEEFPDYNEETFEAVLSGKGKKSDKILGLRNSKFVLTVYLANKIFAALKHQVTFNEQESKRIVSFFKGANCIDYFQLWERIIVYLLVHNDKRGFFQFYTNTIKDIIKLKFTENIIDSSYSEAMIKGCLLHYLKTATELAFALKPEFGDNKLIDDIKIFWNQSKFKDFENYFDINQDFKFIKFRRSNLVRDKYISHPLINYTNLAYNTTISLIDINLPIKIDNKYNNQYLFSEDTNNLSLNKNMQRFSPRLIKLYEATYYYQYQHTIDTTKEVESDSIFVYRSNSELDHLHEAFDVFYVLNYDNLYKDLQDSTKREKKYIEIKKAFFETRKSKVSSFDGFSNKRIIINEVKIRKGHSSFTKCKLSIANTKCNNYYFEQSIEGKPIINSERYKTFSTILNLSKSEKANLLGMPECSVPYDLVPTFAKFGARNNLASVIGLEHWRVENVSFNFIVTIIPIKIDNTPDAIVLYRLKNHYSHEEARHVLTSGSDLKVPVPEVYRYDLINWNNLYFTNFYCYELGNILHRSLFVSLIDLVIASEWNPDTNYFSGIVETASREIHCYFMQVNTSEFGDSRITLPSKSESKNQIQIKGGENDTILISEIDIAKLRRFQYKKYDKQKEDKSFKPTPPDFNRKNVKKRMDNEFIFEIE
ncbi:MAG: hypothetical protein IPM69_13695 [Ignavibacteria bacterium]|nr:hypothetical protein [Ignavibacteria bacterium]